MKIDNRTVQFMEQARRDAEEYIKLRALQLYVESKGYHLGYRGVEGAMRGPLMVCKQLPDRQTTMTVMALQPGEMHDVHDFNPDRPASQEAMPDHPFNYTPWPVRERRYMRMFSWPLCMELAQAFTNADSAMAALERHQPTVSGKDAPLGA